MSISFSDVTVTESGIRSVFVGFANFKYVLFEHADYLGWLQKSVTRFLYSLPVILLLSLVLALLLNQKFRGRLFFRSLYFMPVIIATGTVLRMISSMTGGGIGDSAASESITGNMFSVEDVVAMLNLPSEIAVYVQQIITNIFDLIWNTGIQTVLFLAGLQSIPSSLYEASRVEGATKWEEFWFITFPMLSNVTLLVGVFTMVELFISDRTSMVLNVYSMMRSAVYDETSAMLWAYFLVVGTIMGLVVLLYRRLLQRRWE